MTSARKETLVGGLVLVLGGIFLAYASSGNVAHKQGTESGYLVTARFNRTDGLSVGGAVRLAGLPVGEVLSQTLTDDFRAVVTLKIHSWVKVPKDTAALIQSDGLLGAKYIELQPGGAEKMIEPNDQLSYTQGSIIVDDLLARILSQAKAKHITTKELAATKEQAGPGADKKGAEHEQKPD